MFRLNLKIAWRNLLKNKRYTAINILGLALGLAGFIFIVLVTNYEKSYDTWSPALKNVYQLQEYSDYYSADKKAHWRAEIDYRLSTVAEQLPQVTVATRIDRYSSEMGVAIPGKPAFLQSGFRRTDSLFFKVMPYQFKYGNGDNAFLQPRSLVLKENLALKYFGDINPVGKKVNIAGGSWNKTEKLYTVTGVIREISTPSSVEFGGLIFEDWMFTDDDGGPAEVYVKTMPIQNLGAVNKTLQSSYLPVKDQFLQERNLSLKQAIQEGNAPILKLANIQDVHQAPLEKKSWKETLKPVILLSILLLLVSIINFINLATAQAASRAKEIGVKKVIGAYRKSLVFQFLIETFLQCVLAMFIALLIMEVSLPTLNNFFKLQLSLFHGSSLLVLILQLLFIVIVSGLLTGFYPALFLSGYKPHRVLKGNYSNGKSGAVIRKGLVAMQFVISVSFIIGILIVNYQLKFLKERDNGFTPTGLITMHYGGGGDDEFIEIKKLREIEGVKYVSFSSGVIGDYKSKAYTYKYRGETKELYGWGMGIDGMRTLDARLISGRLFSRSVVQDTVSNAIINETAAKMFHENMVGKTIMNAKNVPVTIIGVIKDIQVEGFENAVKPTVYAVYTGKWGGVGFTVKPTTLVRYELSKGKEVLRNIEKYFASQNEFYPVNYTLTEDDLSNVLIDHERFERMVAVFSFLSLALSLFGLFALAAFITKQRTKEIAVRKVLGAENRDILVLLNKGYVWILLIANVIAFPLAYILITKWLSTFAYRIEISPMPFVIAFITSVIITLITVSLQARKAIGANPVKALKYE